MKMKYLKNPITLYLSQAEKQYSHSHIPQKTHSSYLNNFKEERASTHMLTYSREHIGNCTISKMNGSNDDDDDGDGALHDHFEFRQIASLGQILSLNHFYDPMFQKKSVCIQVTTVPRYWVLSSCQLSLRKIVQFMHRSARQFTDIRLASQPTDRLTDRPRRIHGATVGACTYSSCLSSTFGLAHFHIELLWIAFLSSIARDAYCVFVCLLARLCAINSDSHEFSI